MYENRGQKDDKFWKIHLISFYVYDCPLVRQGFRNVYCCCFKENYLKTALWIKFLEVEFPIRFVSETALTLQKRWQFQSWKSVYFLCLHFLGFAQRVKVKGNQKGGKEYNCLMLEYVVSQWTLNLQQFF